MTTLPLLRYSVGIDVAKDKMALCLCELRSDLSLRIIASGSVSNTPEGFDQLHRWIKTRYKQTELPLQIVLEATGIYHESLAWFLHQQGYQLSVLLANQARAYAKSLNLRSKDDQVDAHMLARLGLERRLTQWQPASEQMYTLKQLCRERSQLQQQQTQVKNQQHALQHSKGATSAHLERLAKRLALLATQLAEIEADMKALIKADASLQKAVQRLTTLQGVGWLTAVILLAETNGFQLFTSKGQLVSYAGYDVVRQQSGSSLNKPGHISKRGSRHLRKALYWPALTSIRYQGPLQDLYNRVYERTKVKMKALVAVQRKLLVLAYSLHKTERDYEVAYQQNRQAQRCCPA